MASTGARMPEKAGSSQGQTSRMLRDTDLMVVVQPGLNNILRQSFACVCDFTDG